MAVTLTALSSSMLPRRNCGISGPGTEYGVRGVWYVGSNAPSSSSFFAPSDASATLGSSPSLHRIWRVVAATGQPYPLSRTPCSPSRGTEYCLPNMCTATWMRSSDSTPEERPYRAAPLFVFLVEKHPTLVQRKCDEQSTAAASACSSDEQSQSASRDSPRADMSP